MEKKSNLSQILQVARDILSETKSKDGFHINEIAAIAIGKNKTMGMTKEEFASKVGSALAANIKTQKPTFSKPTSKKGVPKKGYYRLKRGVVTATPIIKLPPQQFNTNYSGKAGEFAVASELLFWGFNVSTMAVDQGIDLIAEKEGKFWYIQVKTSTSVANNGSFGFSIDQKPFNETQSKSPFYVLVMREGMNTDFAVIPGNLLMHLRNAGIIGGKNLSIQISRDDKRRQYKLNGSQDINTYINNFRLI